MEARRRLYWAWFERGRDKSRCAALEPGCCSTRSIVEDHPGSRELCRGATSRDIGLGGRALAQVCCTEEGGRV